MGYYPILKTTWKYFPKKKGFLTGLILCVFGLCPMIFTSIADYVINPNGVSMENHVFDEKISLKMKNFALIMAISMGICGIISQILMFPIDNIISRDEIEENNSSNINIQESFINNEIYSRDKESKNKNIVENEETDKNEPVMQAFKSWRFHLFNFMSVGTLCNL